MITPERFSELSRLINSIGSLKGERNRQVNEAALAARNAEYWRMQGVDPLAKKREAESKIAEVDAQIDEIGRTVSAAVQAEASAIQEDLDASCSSIVFSKRLELRAALLHALELIAEINKPFEEFRRRVSVLQKQVASLNSGNPIRANLISLVPQTNGLAVSVPGIPANPRRDVGYSLADVLKSVAGQIR